MVISIKGTLKLKQDPFELVEDLIFALNSKFEFEYVNEYAFSKKLGYSQVDLIGKNFTLNFIHPDEISETIKILRKQFKTEGRVNIGEVRILSKSKSYIWYDIEGKSFTDNDGNKKVLLISREITKYKSLKEDYENIIKDLEKKIPEIRFWKLLYPEKCISAVRKTREMLESVIDNIPQYICWKDIHFTYVGCNKNFASMNGFEDPAALSGKVDSELKWQRLNKESLIASETRVFKSQIPEFNKIERLILPTGENAYFKTNRIPLFNSLGVLEGLLITYEDVTNSLKGQEKLKESEEKYRSMINNLDLGFFKVDTNGIIIDHNPALCKLYGYNPSESLIGKPGQDLLSTPEEIENFSNKIQTTGNLRGYIHRGKTKDGRSIILQADTHLNRDKENHLVDIEGTVFDITAKYNLEQKLKHSEENYRLITENSNDLIRVLNDKLFIEFINEYTHLKSLKYSKEDLIGKNALNLVHPEEFRETREFLRIVFKEGEGIREGRIKDKNGVWQWHEIKGRAYQDENGMTKLLFVSRDISDRKNYEEKLEALNKELEQKFNQKTEELRKSEENYRNMINYLDVGFYKGELKGNLLAHNRAFNEILALDPSISSVGAKTVDLFADKETQENYYSQLAQNGYVRNFTARVKKANGEIAVIQINAHLTKKLEPFKQEIEGTFFDITEKYSLEQKLKESEEKFRDLFNRSPFSIVLFDEKGQIVDVNLSTEKLYGYEKNELVGQPYISLINVYSPATVSIMKERAEKLKKGQNVEPIEIQVKKKDGTMTWITSSISSIKMGQQKLYQAIVQDITEKKQADLKLKESEEKYRNLFEESPFSIVLFDLNGIIIDFNDALEKTLGYPKQEYIGKSFLEIGLLQPDIVPLFRERLKRYGSGEKLQPVEVPVFKKDGTKALLNPTVSLVNLTKEKLIQVIFQDITEKKEREKELKESEEKFRTIAEQSLMGIGIVQAGLVKYANQALANIFEYTPDEIKNWKNNEFLKEIIHPEDLEKAWSKIQEKQRSGYNKSTEYSFRIKTKSGKIKWIESFSKSISYQNKIADLTVMIDITEKKEAESKLIEQNLELKRLDQLKNDFITYAAHDLKTPLSSIYGYTEYILMKYDNLDSEMTEDLLKVQKNSMQLRFYVDQLIDVMKIDAKKISLNFQKKKMINLIKDCIGEFKIPIFEKNLTVNLFIDENLELNVDSLRLCQAFSNLLSNAIKFTQPYGKIEISSELRSEDCLIKIKDNGIGLTEQEMAQIFEKFVMLNQSTEELSKFGKGSGLGLYIAKGIVEAHGGRIGVKSEGQDKGSEFYFTLPIKI